MTIMQCNLVVVLTTYLLHLDLAGVCWRSVVFISLSSPSSLLSCLNPTLFGLLGSAASPLQLFVINNRECGACVVRVSYGGIMSNKISQFFNDKYKYHFSCRLSHIPAGIVDGPYLRY